MQITSEVLKLLRKLNGGKASPNNKLIVDYVGQSASDQIKQLLLQDRPCMVSRFGSNELDATLRTYERQQCQGFFNRAIRYVKGESADFWWDRSIRKRMSNVAGFFPATDRFLTRFGERILEDIDQIDVLGSWREDEFRLRSYFPNAQRIHLIDLEPFRHNSPWSAALAGKKVLVIHPFVESIQKQYQKRNDLFANPEVLPEFDLKVIKAVQSNGKNRVDFSSWFAALDHMCDQINKHDFDTAVIGAGAYGLPLAAFVKRLGKQSIHLGGATQLLFGIKGHRWDASYQEFYNGHWVRPLSSEKPARADLVEQGCYW
ncbi:MAG: hypothetical protein P8M80_18125 [Pirellulaceae bacterium]|jgi:hypothetical protein|nr:hypothetical protein [Mariniblastus sp.]MDB4756526.1 hypothetical protein [Mariniblastus sp.]MDG2471206.1 hypothetical protein [Pirellulaceae bacterium]